MPAFLLLSLTLLPLLWAAPPAIAFRLHAAWSVQFAVLCSLWSVPVALGAATSISLIDLPGPADARLTMDPASALVVLLVSGVSAGAVLYGVRHAGAGDHPLRVGPLRVHLRGTALNLLHWSLAVVPLVQGSMAFTSLWTTVALGAVFVLVNALEPPKGLL